MEKSEFLVQIQNLQKEIYSLSSLSLAKEKENIRKDLEKTKFKLKEVEFKLKTAVQEKTKLEVLYHFSCIMYLFLYIYPMPAIPFPVARVRRHARREKLRDCTDRRLFLNVI